MSRQKIISVSRRGDIAAFHTQWFINRIRAGFCYYQNPYGGKIYRVSLNTKDCAGIVFWTRNPSPLFKYIDELKQTGYYFYFHMTITGYPKQIEPNAPLLDTSIKRFTDLAEKMGFKGVHWRYDPILLSNLTPESFHIDNFSYIAEKLRGKTSVCTISFTDFYGKTKKNLSIMSKKYGIEFEEPSIEKKKELSRKLKGIGSANGIELKSCCDNSLVEAAITRGSCISEEYLYNVREDFNGGFSKKPTRPECGCYESVDIGAYDTCLFGCSYCYATRSREIAINHFNEHDVQDTILLRSKKYKWVDLAAIAEPSGSKTGSVQLSLF